MRRSVLLLLPFLAACYTYAPVDLAGVNPGTEVRVRVSAAASDQIAPLLGAINARLLTGSVVDAGRDTMVVEVPTVVRAEIGSAVQTLRQRVSVARRDIVEVETRKLDRTRTYLLVGGVSAIALSSAIRALNGNPGSERTPGGGSTDALVPLFRFVWR